MKICCALLFELNRLRFRLIFLFIIWKSLRIMNVNCFMFLTALPEIIKQIECMAGHYDLRVFVSFLFYFTVMVSIKYYKTKRHSPHKHNSTSFHSTGKVRMGSLKNKDF